MRPRNLIVVVSVAAVVSGCSSEPEESGATREESIASAQAARANDGEADVGTMSHMSEMGDPIPDADADPSPAAVAPEQVLGTWRVDLDSMREVARSNGVPGFVINSMVPKYADMRLRFDEGGEALLTGKPDKADEPRRWWIEGDRVYMDPSGEPNDPYGYMVVVPTDDGIVLQDGDPEGPVRFVRVEP